MLGPFGQEPLSVPGGLSPGIAPDRVFGSATVPVWKADFSALDAG